MNTLEIHLPNKSGIALISEEDADLTNFKWSLSSNGYAKRKLYLPSGKRIDRTLHHDIAYRIYEGPFTRAAPIEHLNHNKLDCRRSNLLWSTNNANSLRHTQGSCSFCKASGKYRVRIVYKNKQILIYSSVNEEKAQAISKEAHKHLISLLDSKGDLTFNEVYKAFKG